VAVSDWRIPLRLDRVYGTSDLKRIGRARLTGTLPLKWIYQIHWILFGRPGLKWRGAHRSNLGFRPSSPARRAGVDLRRGYNGFQMTAMTRR
jgi:hypothetical protein